MLTSLFLLKDWDRKETDLEVEVWVSTIASLPSFIAPVYKIAQLFIVCAVKHYKFLVNSHACRTKMIDDKVTWSMALVVH